MKPTLLQKIESLSKSKILIVVWSTVGLALVLRFILAITSQGYTNDLALFHYWANQVFSHGITNFYHLDIFVDYPPGYIYVLYIIGALFKLVAVEAGSYLYLFLLKLPIIVVDCLAAFIIYKKAKQRFTFIVSLALMALFLFNPWTLINGVVWGQVDVIFTLILCLSLFALSEEKTIKASIFYALAALIKPQAFIFMPVILIYLFNRKQIKHWLLCIVTGFSTFLLLAIPFFIKGDGIKQIIALYSETLSSYPYASLNTYNIYSLFGYNWAQITNNIATMPIALLSYIAIVLTVLLVLYYSIRLQKHGSYYFYLATIIITSVYLFVAKMHERYIFPVLLCLLFAYIYEKNKHYLYILVGFSVTTSINLLQVLSIHNKSYTVPYDVFLVSCSLINLGLFIYLLRVGYKNFKPKQTLQNVIEDDEMLNSRQTINKSSDRHKLNKLHVFGVTLLYTVVAFYQLGVNAGPETSWKPVEQGEYIVFDFGEVKSIDRIVVFTGPSHEGSYSFSSYDNETWVEQTHIVNEHTFALANKVWDVNMKTQYVMLHAVKTGFKLQEVAFFNNSNKDAPLPVTINLTDSPETDKSKAQHLIDEQSTMVYNPTFLHGTYFDEIYHARTAFEYMTGEAIYETTHPPLGKIIIMLGMQLVGFGPFGWRLMGTLFGIAVLLLIYQFAKLLFQKHSYALTAMILFAVDFMHFAQSRLSTIDIYSVTFTMLMFYFMARYSKMNFYKTTLLKTLVPLALSGLFFGIGIATKWNGFYGGAGLAVMLLIVLIQRYIEAKRQRQVEGPQVEKVSYTKETTLKSLLNNPVKPTQYWHAVILTLLSCCLFFVAIPFLIYYSVFQLSFRLSGSELGWTNFIQAQQYMYSYHSKLVDTHPFASPWYEWQIMYKPIWYYVNNSLPNGALTSTITAFGNPLIWWGSILTLFITLGWSIYKRHMLMAVIYIGYFSQLLPWVFVDRITFIYHFFGMVPFLILSMVYVFVELEKRYKWVYVIRWLFVMVALGLFVLFYPVLSGQPIERSFVDQVLRWFSSWYF